MKRRLLVPLLVAILSLALGTASNAEFDQEKNLRVTFNAAFSPHKLPRDRFAPVRVQIEGRVATTDGSQPPPLRWLEVELQSRGRISTRGLPVCAAPTLQSTSTETALERCRSARVGSGSFRAVADLGRPVPASGSILAFNSRTGGKPSLLLHFFSAIPVRFTLVVPLEIGHRRDKELGTVLRSKIPRVGRDLASVTKIQLELGRRYSYRGESRSYLSAACSAPAGFPGVTFLFARGKFRFEGHKTLEVPLHRNCQVR